MQKKKQKKSIYFLIDRKYPLSLIIEPSSSMPSFHPSFSISSDGITKTHLYFGDHAIKKVRHD